MKTYTTAQAAKKAGITRQTLHFWITEKLIDAPACMRIGKREFRMWTDADIQKLKDFKGTLQPGPRPKKGK